MRSLCFSEDFWGLFSTNRKVRKGKPIILWTFLLSRSCYSNTTATRWSNSTFYFSLKNQTAEKRRSGALTSARKRFVQQTQFWQDLTQKLIFGQISFRLCHTSVYLIFSLYSIKYWLVIFDSGLNFFAIHLFLYACNFDRHIHLL